jgi:hypothetical protein
MDADREYILEIRSSIRRQGLTFEAAPLPPVLRAERGTPQHPNLAKIAFTCPLCGAAHNVIVPNGVEHNVIRVCCPACKLPRPFDARKEEGKR